MRPRRAHGLAAARAGESDGAAGPRHHGRELGRRRRMFESGDFRILLLSLLEEQPRHGYELIRAIEQMFSGQYAPSPGIVYPTLALLEEQGLAALRAAAGEARKRYALTSEGHAWLKDHADEVRGVRARLAIEVRALQSAPVPEALQQALRTLKHALLLDRSPWSETRTRRVMLAIEQAIEAVGQGPGR